MAFNAVNTDSNPVFKFNPEENYNKPPKLSQPTEINRQTKQYDHNYPVHRVELLIFFPEYLGSGKVTFKQHTRKATCVAQREFASHIK